LNPDRGRCQSPTASYCSCTTAEHSPQAVNRKNTSVDVTTTLTTTTTTTTTAAAAAATTTTTTTTIIIIIKIKINNNI